MSKPLKIALGGKHYEVPKLNIAQLREVTRLFKGDQSEISFDVLKIAFERVKDAGPFDEIEAGLDEVAAAAAAILEHAGLRKQEAANPPPAPESTG